MMRPISSAALTVLDLTPPDTVTCAAETGYRHVGIRLLPATPTEAHDDTPPLREVQRRLADTGVKVLDAEIFRIKPATRVADYEAAIATAARLVPAAIPPTTDAILAQAPAERLFPGDGGLDLVGLRMRRHFEAQRQVDDPQFGRGSPAYNRKMRDPLYLPNPCVAPIEHGPFYAVKVQPGSFGTFSGLKTNEFAQVLNRQGNVIDGLYSVGTDMASMMGGFYPSGGINLGPATTFGYFAGKHATGAVAEVAAPQTAFTH